MKDLDDWKAEVLEKIESDQKLQEFLTKTFGNTDGINKEIVEVAFDILKTESLSFKEAIVVAITVIKFEKRIITGECNKIPSGFFQ